MYARTVTEDNVFLTLFEKGRAHEKSLREAKLCLRFIPLVLTATYRLLLEELYSQGLPPLHPTKGNAFGIQLGSKLISVKGQGALPLAWCGVELHERKAFCKQAVLAFYIPLVSTPTA